MPAHGATSPEEVDEIRPLPLSALIEELARAPDESLLPARKKALKAGERVGRFEIVREIGRGGFGAVYEALDLELGRKVALKTLQPQRTARELSADWVKREAEAIARLDHPCIVTLHDVGSSHGGPFLVMEFLEGETLARRLRAGPLLTAEGLHVATQVARGLAHAHKRGILHRDVKPANVFLCEDGRVKLLDFGLAHLLGVHGAGGAGTPGYMPPEQAKGEEIDACADVYAAAMTLRESLTGSRDGKGDALLPRGVALPVGRALSASRKDRPRDGTAWLEALAGAQKALERPRRVARAATLGMVGIALAAGLAYLAWNHGRGSSPAAEAGTPSVAVLAFADMSPGRDQGYLGDGVAEEVLNGLAQVDGLRVVGRGTSFSYKGKDRKVEEIGRELGVDAVLDGSVRRSGDRVRITAQLVRTSNAATIWSQSFDRNLADVFALQDEIGKAVVDALRVRLLPGKVVARTGGSTHPDALQQYLKGRDQVRTGDSPRALEAFEKAVAIDPRFALAWAGIANAIVTIEATFSQEGSQASRKRARQAAEKAVELAPGLADAWLARADVRFWLENDWRGQAADVERARSLAPGDPLVALSSGLGHLANGNLDAAIAEFERAVAIEPRVWQGWMNGWIALCTARISREDHEQARAACRRALELFPDFDEPRWGLGMDYIVAGQPEEALAEGGRCKASNGYGALLNALAFHDLGRRDEARAVLPALEEKWGEGGAYQIAEVHAWTGDADGAFEWLERARTQRDTAMFWLKTDPLLKKIRGDPRWAELVQRVESPPGTER